MQKILYTTPVLEHPAAGGPQISVETCIKALSRVSDLHIISRVPVGLIGGETAQRFYEKYCKGFFYSPSARLLPKNEYLLRAKRRWIKFTDQDVKFVLKYFDENEMDVIWCDRVLDLAPSFDFFCRIKLQRPDIKVVGDTCAVQSRFVLREFPYQKSPGRRKAILTEGELAKRNEQMLVDTADVTTAVSEVDAQYFRSIAKDSGRIKIFSNVVDVHDFQNIQPPKDIKRPCIIVTGSFYGVNSPMENGTRWVLQDVLPLVRQQIPDIHLYIVGRGSDEIMADIDDTGITITGKVPSVKPYLCYANVAIVPLKFESGTRFKILEAGAAGIPVVSTTLGAEGINVTDKKDILIADEASGFADSIIMVIEDKRLANELSDNLRNLVIENYSIESLAREGRSILNYLEG